MAAIKSIEERFWVKVDKSAGPDGCWPWTGTRTSFGHGSIRGYRTRKLAHRVSYEIHRGPIPSGLWICHHCDNPWCVNPAHLFAGTPVDNVQDMIRKGRKVRQFGEAHPQSTHTTEQILAIRHDTRRQVEIARSFGVSPRFVSKVKSGKAWPHVS